jgi:hypothetical protein
VVAYSICMAVVGFIGVTRSNLFACSCGKQIPRIACTLVRVDARVRAAAVTAAYNATVLRRQQSTVIDVDASLSIAAEPIGTGPTHEAIARRSHIHAAHTIETRSLAATISVYTHCTSPTVACTARAAVASWAFVVAECVCVTVVLSCVARPNLHTGLLSAHVGERVALVARAIIRARTSISTAAEAARVADAVINVSARLSVPSKAIWTAAARVALQWCAKVVARNTSEARRRCAVIPVAALHSVASVACTARAAMASWAFVVAECVRVTVVLSCVARPNLYACARASRVDFHCVASVTVARVLPNPGVDTISVQPAGRTIAVRIVTCDPSGFCGFCHVNHPDWALAAHKPFARCSNIGALNACKARVVSTAVGVNTRVSIASVSRLAGAAVLSWTLMVADCVLMAVVFAQLAGVHLLAYSTCTSRQAAEVSPAKITRALIRVGAGVRAAAVCTARVIDAVPDVVALFSVAVESRRTRSANVALARCNHINARHAGEAWVI